MILLVSAHFPPEPVTAATLAHDLANALSEKHEVTVITPKPSRPQGFPFSGEKAENGRFEHLVLDSYTCAESTFHGRMRESYSFGRHAVRFIKKNYATINCIYVLAWPLLAQYQIVRASKRYGIPAITHVVDIYPESLINKLPLLKKPVYTMLFPMDRYILQKSSSVITISPGMKNMLKETRKLKDNQVEVVYTWLNDAVFSNHKQTLGKKSEETPFTFMFLGSLSPSAALETVILGFHQSGLKNTRLVIAGNGCEKERLMSLVRDCGNPHILFKDAPPYKVPELQDQADVLMISLRRNSAHFAMPSKLPAYMFSRKPVIACVEQDSDIAGVVELADCGWVVKPEDSNALAAAMTIAVSTPKQKLIQHGENGYHYARQTFSRERNLGKMVSIVESL